MVKEAVQEPSTPTKFPERFVAGLVAWHVDVELLSVGADQAREPVRRHLTKCSNRPFWPFDS
jgi:hypothetical protein